MEANQDSYTERCGLFGDLPTRMMVWLIRTFPRMPYALEWSLLHLSVLVIFILARQQRHAIRENLKHIYPDLSIAEGLWGGFCVLRNFGWTYIDSLRAKLGQNCVTWELVGEETFQKIKSSREAAILFTTHTGNYDLAACLFAAEFGRTLHTVRVPERTKKLQKIRQREFEADMAKYPYFKVHYNTSDNLLGMELVKLLGNGELLALQCDRVFGDVVGMEVPWSDDVSFRVPMGPMTLASISKCPCYPLFVVRGGKRHYKVIFEPALQLDPKVRRPRAMDYALPWVQRVEGFLRSYSHEWFVFEQAFSCGHDTKK